MTVEMELLTYPSEKSPAPETKAGHKFLSWTFLTASASSSLSGISEFLSLCALVKANSLGTFLYQPVKVSLKPDGKSLVDILPYETSLQISYAYIAVGGK